MDGWMDGGREGGSWTNDSDTSPPESWSIGIACIGSHVVQKGEMVLDIRSGPLVPVCVQQPLVTTLGRTHH